MYKRQVSVLTIGHNGNLGKIKIPLAQVEKASKLEIRLQIEGTGHCNRWNIWVYPNDVKPEWKNVKYTRDYAEALALLQKGNKVLLHNRLALKKRVYEASDWESFRNAVNAHKAYGEYLVIKK